ncbi:MAG: hypothetical protein JW867_07780 [Candidatus Omnitrophica bacterium]|nr:hypothetical protein [Candidatus Omnitrophota bacterium]
MFCSKCGKENSDENLNCSQCSNRLKPEEPQVKAQVEPAFGNLIPYKNSYGLTAYYLAIFSVIPCLGLILGIPAFFFGLKGFAVYKQNPEVKGKVHSLVGILLGGLCGLVNLIAFIVAIINMAIKS